MRVTLPDRPGSLGAVATAMGGVGGDINAVEIVEKGDGIVVDDFIVDLPPNQLPETIVTACQSLPGVRVEWISRYPEGGGLQSDLEALERMTADPVNAAETLASLCPVVFRSHFAALVSVATASRRSTLLDHAGAGARREHGAELLARSTAPTASTCPPTGRPGWGETTVVVTPLTQDRVIAIGRLGGPTFMDSEIARLHHLAALVK